RRGSPERDRAAVQSRLGRRRPGACVRRADRGSLRRGSARGAAVAAGRRWTFPPRAARAASHPDRRADHFGGYFATSFRIVLKPRNVERAASVFSSTAFENIDSPCLFVLSQ